MKLLIVDDNKYVVEGMLRKLDWNAYGIDELFGCYNVVSDASCSVCDRFFRLISDIECARAGWLCFAGVDPGSGVVRSEVGCSPVIRISRYRRKRLWATRRPNICLKYCRGPGDRAAVRFGSSSWSTAANGFPREHKKLHFRCFGGGHEHGGTSGHGRRDALPF